METKLEEMAMVRGVNKKFLLCLMLFIFIIVRISFMILSGVNQYEIIKRAKDMTYVKWTPPEDMSMWKSDEGFKKGIVYEGIPYTWSTNQVRSSREFLQKLNNGNKLEFTEGNCTGPNYGNDCSGFVSAVWGIPRCTTRNIEKYTKNIALNDLKPGDALITDGHIMLFSNWNNEKHTSLAVYEQTPPKARMQTYSISYLNSKKYKAIRLKVCLGV
jgi:hypothetical protein